VIFVFILATKRSVVTVKLRVNSTVYIVNLHHEILVFSWRRL